MTTGAQLIEDWRINAARHIYAYHFGLAGRHPPPGEDLLLPLLTEGHAALAQSTDCEIVTFDRGFRSFAQLKLRLLTPAA